MRILAHFFPMFNIDTPEDIRKPEVLWCVQGDPERTLEGNPLSTVLRRSQIGSKQFRFFKITSRKAITEIIKIRSSQIALSYPSKRHFLEISERIEKDLSQSMVAEKGY